MSNALEQASLIMVPSGYEDGTLGSLKPTDGSGDFTFTRCNGAAQCDLAATRVNADGYIEKGYENLLTYSNDFSQWTKAATTATSGQSGYDGSSDAWLIEKSNSNGVIYKSLSSISVGTISVYAKASASNWMAIYTGTSLMFFDLANGVLGGGSGEIDYKIEAVSGATGWYRCSVVDTSITSFSIYPAEGDGDRSGTSGSIYIQDAMLNQGLVAYPYVETTTAPVAGGILEDMPRLDYSNGSCPSLLLEPSRTNLIEYSEYFGAGSWSKGNITLTTNDSKSIEGVDNATLIYPTATATGLTYMFNSTSGSLGRYTISAFVKADGKDVCWLYIDGVAEHGIIYFDLSDESIQVVAGTNSTPTGTITDMVDGWHRITFTLGTDLAIGRSSGIGVSDAKGSTAVTKSGEDGVLVYGLQIEAGTYPTSYIPTYGVSQTRLAETATTSVDSTGDWTLYFEFDTTLLANGDAYISGSILESIRIYIEDIWWRYNGTNRYFQNSGVNTIKLLFRRTSGSIDAFYNGTERYSGIASTTTGVQDTLLKGGKHRQMLFFPTALSDEACIELTTIS